ncbi:MAG: glycosyltransferase, partial [Patescibacteria group bacterium]
MRLLDLRWWFGLKPKIVFASPKKYSISVIIPAYNEEKSIAATVESIKKQTVEIGKIIVVDDCSSDRTGEIAAAS